MHAQIGVGGASPCDACGGRRRGLSIRMSPALNNCRCSINLSAAAPHFQNTRVAAESPPSPCFTVTTVRIAWDVAAQVQVPSAYASPITARAANAVQPANSMAGGDRIYSRYGTRAHIATILAADPQPLAVK